MNPLADSREPWKVVFNTPYNLFRNKFEGRLRNNETRSRDYSLCNILFIYLFFSLCSLISLRRVYDMEDNDFARYIFIQTLFIDNRNFRSLSIYIIHIFYSSNNLTFINSATFINVQKLLMIVRLLISLFSVDK